MEDSPTSRFLCNSVPDVGQTTWCTTPARQSCFNKDTSCSCTCLVDIGYQNCSGPGLEPFLPTVGVCRLPSLSLQKTATTSCNNQQPWLPNAARLGGHLPPSWLRQSPTLHSVLPLFVLKTSPQPLKSDLYPNHQHRNKPLPYCELQQTSTNLNKRPYKLETRL